MEQQKNVDLKTSSVTELKAFAFDILVQIENSQKNLQMINQEIAKRSNILVVEPKVDGEQKV